MKHLITKFSVALLMFFSFVWVVYHSFNAMIVAGYLPNVLAGHWGFALWWMFPLLALLNVVGVLLYLHYHHGATRAPWVGMALLFAIALAAYSSSFIERPLAVTYYIDLQKYEIPWQYEPRNGSEKIGGTYFVVLAEYPDLSPIHSSGADTSRTLTLSKVVARPGDVTDPVIDEECEQDGLCGFLGMNTQFVRDGFLYRIHYQGTAQIVFKTSEEQERFKSSVVALFDSFKK